MTISQDQRDFESFFTDATGFSRPYRWQVRVATEGLPEVLPVPTGLGKTEGVVLAWAWRKLLGLDEPLHLIYCLPMRTLVRQTVKRLSRYFCALNLKRGMSRIPVYRLMGGAIDDEWARNPDKPWILVGTQDQLLSRALNRGYAMSRFEWPIHFGLLNQDCHWIVDEVQLMGPGLWTTSQLDWMRRKRFHTAKPCRTTWMSATVGTGFLATTDRKSDQLDSTDPFDPRLDDDDNEELRRRLSARRAVRWLAPATGKRTPPIHEQIASQAQAEHCDGTLTLIICNQVKTAQQVFGSLTGAPAKILLTSQFRKGDRRDYEQRLLDFEARRAKTTTGRLDGDSGLICVSTQVVEAGVDVSAHRLWSELAPWPSIVQRLGRLNRDGRDDEDARAIFWRDSNAEELPRDGDIWIGPYMKGNLDKGAQLLDHMVEPSSRLSFTKAMAALETTHGQLLSAALQPALAPLPRALDVHGLFSTERDVHGGFTDVSAFVRGSDWDADLTVFWRSWPGSKNRPRGDGPPFNPDDEGCAVAFYRLSELLKKQRDSAWIWNDEEGGRWERCAHMDLRPGMVVMVHQHVGGYDIHLGWTGEREHFLKDVEPAGKGRALKGDERTEEKGKWTPLDAHLNDAHLEAERICDALRLRADDNHTKQLRLAVVEAARLHDIGKSYPKWQQKLPSGAAAKGGPWAKCPRVLGVDIVSGDSGVKDIVARLCPGALPLRACPKKPMRLRWAVGRKLKRKELKEFEALAGFKWAGYEAFRPDMRHEAASALAMWNRYRDGEASYPALAVYLVAAHHGKVRTVLRSTSSKGDNVFGVPRPSEPLDLYGERWPFDFSVAVDGATGEWLAGKFLLSDFGWTGMVSDLLGPWQSREVDLSNVGAVPEGEPRSLGPFVLAWLEALVRVADWRASEHPSQGFAPSEVPYVR